VIEGAYILGLTYFEVMDTVFPLLMVDDAKCSERTDVQQTGCVCWS
jgi:hypothetical protein